MNKVNLDQIVEQVRDERIDPEEIAAATARVRERIFAAAADPEVTTLRTCADFQGLMRAYLTKTLGESRTLLLEDHVHSCVDCRRALSAARSGKVRMMPRPSTVQRELPPTVKWSIAAAVLLAAGLSSWGVVRMLPSGGTRAAVESVSGVLYSLGDQSSVPVFAGRQVGDGQHLRTAKDSTALLRLSDGSLVEMNERAEVSISKSARGTTIRLDHGNVIVQAAKQKNGALYVSTPDCLVTVHGTVFAVTRGVKGTRVSVAQGEVRVDESGRTVLLHRGDQTATNASIENTSVKDEFVWSRNSAKYLELLGELSSIQKKLFDAPGPALRYSSRLLDLVPADTVLYAAIPNLGNTLAEANRLFNERIQQSDVLRQWWTAHQPKGPLTIEDMVNRLRTFSSYLGDEVVLSISAAQGEGQYNPPLLLAEVKKPGLKQFLEGQVRDLAAKGGSIPFRFVDDPQTELRDGAAQQGAVFATIKDNVIAIGSAGGIAEFTNPNRQTFDDTYFHRVIAQSYESGAGWLFCANLEHLLRGSVMQKEGDDKISGTGLSDVRFLIYERKQAGGETINRVALNFLHNRRSFASWLGAPGPMGALDYVSPNALVAGAFVLKNPRSLLGDLFTYAEGRNSNFTKQLDEFEHRSGISVLNDLAATLGTDVAFAIDGPIFPTPYWEFAIEAYSPDRLEWTIEKLVDDFNRNSQLKLKLEKEKVDGRMFYTLTSEAMNVEANYTFSDGYFIAGATRGLLLRAIQNKNNGFTLSRSEKFRALLPRDTHASFSGLIYHNVGPLIGPLADQLKSLGAVTPQQRASIAALAENNGPGLIFAYGEPNRIVISGRGPLFGLSLDSMAVPHILANVIDAQRRLHQSQ